MFRLFICLALALSALVAGTANSTSAAFAFQERSSTYVALGDSVAAGFGLAAGSETTRQDVLCARSSSAYPFLVGEALGTGVRQLACSGAKFDEGLYGSQEVDEIQLPEQIARAFEIGTPGRMSITIGANDMRWRYFVSKCYLAKCGTASDTALFELLRLDLRYEQWRMRFEVEYQSNQNGTGVPPTVLTGYYNPFGDDNCAATQGITATEKRWIQDRLVSINGELRRAASKESWLTFADVDPAFSGHRLCSTDVWVSNPDSDGRLHATAEGQQAYATIVASLLG